MGMREGFRAVTKITRIVSSLAVAFSSVAAVIHTDRGLGELVIMAAVFWVIAWTLAWVIDKFVE